MRSSAEEVANQSRMRPVQDVLIGYATLPGWRTVVHGNARATAHNSREDRNPDVNDHRNASIRNPVAVWTRMTISGRDLAHRRISVHVEAQVAVQATSLMNLMTGMT